MDNTKLAEIKSRAEAATPGPWRHWPEAGDIEITTDGYKEPIVSKVRPRLGWGEDIYVDNQEPDADFIAHAREDIPALIDALEDAEAELTRRDTVIERATEEAHFLSAQDLNHEEDNFAAGQVDAAESIRKILAAAPVSLEAVKAAGLPGQIVTLAFEDGVTTFECNLEGCECPEHDNGPAKAGTYVTVRLDSDVRIGLSRVLIITEGDDRG